jgi:hypothetical protein
MVGATGREKKVSAAWRSEYAGHVADDILSCEKHRQFCAEKISARPESKAPWPEPPMTPQRSREVTHFHIEDGWKGTRRAAGPFPLSDQRTADQW